MQTITLCVLHTVDLSMESHKLKVLRNACWRHNRNWTSIIFSLFEKTFFPQLPEYHSLGFPTFSQITSFSVSFFQYFFGTPKSWHISRVSPWTSFLPIFYLLMTLAFHPHCDNSSKCIFNQKTPQRSRLLYLNCLLTFHLAFYQATQTYQGQT